MYVCGREGERECVCVCTQHSDGGDSTESSQLESYLNLKLDFNGNC